ncbi:MAG TPA: hypothetical protein PKA69_00510, partial [Lacibacter sp.]|nr:hypothetical protein [Lacibacter sp.]
RPEAGILDFRIAISDFGLWATHSPAGGSTPRRRFCGTCSVLVPLWIEGRLLLKNRQERKN